MRVPLLNRNDVNRGQAGNPVRRYPRTALMLVGCLAQATTLLAQTPSSRPMSVSDAIELARKYYPALKEVRARAGAAEEGVSVARTYYLPRLDLLWQTNRATRNNVFGLLLPQGIVPPISGPGLGTTTYDSAWSSAAGVLLPWPAV